jgi:lipopolysaccharide export system protein LptC
MTDYYYEDEYEEDPGPPPPARKVRFDPRRDRGADYFDRAHRHSRLVRSLKYGLPALALVSVAGFFLIVQMAPGAMDGGAAAVISLSGVDVENKSLVMDKPNISGFEGTRHSYEVTAAQAVQNLANSRVVTLNAIAATIGIGGDQTALVKAVTGVLDSTTKIIDLKGGIDLDTTSGYKARLEEATIDFEKGHLVSKKPVKISGKEGTINANAMEVIDRGKRIIFTGGVKVTIIPGDDPEPQQAEAADAEIPARPGTKPAGGKS